MPRKKSEPGRLEQSIAHHALLMCFLEATSQLLNVSRDVILREYEENEKDILDNEKDNLLRNARIITRHPSSLEGYTEASSLSVSLLASDAKNMEYIEPAASKAAQIIATQLVEKMRALTEEA